MSSPKRLSRAAYVEDLAEDDSGSSIEGNEETRRYAVSEAPMSPVKDQPNSGKLRTDKRHSISQRRSGSNSPTVNFVDPDTNHRPSGHGKDRPSRRSSQELADQERDLRHQRERENGREQLRRERRFKEEEADRRRRADATAVAKEWPRQSFGVPKTSKKTRPMVKHTATQPLVQQHSYKRGHVDEPASYGVQQPAASSSRPRQTRPNSYYAGQSSRPPVAGMGWHPPPPPGVYPGSAFPAPHMYTGVGPPPPGFAAHPPPSPGGPHGYFDSALGGPQHLHLKQRFENRPSSAMGHQSSSSRGFDDPRDDEPQRIVRRPSRSKKTEEDRRKMPPPPLRPQSAAVPSTPFRPPPSQRPMARQVLDRPPSSHRRSVGFADDKGYDDDDYLGDDLFQDSPESSYEQRHAALVRRSRRASVAYEQQGYDIVPATTKGRSRRASVYGVGPVGSAGASPEEEKYMEALRYQDNLTGGPQVPLTAETLRKASRRGVPSSRSTRSSESRDDSEYKRSNTTGITRSSSGNNDDVTIKVTGGAVVRVPGAEIECSEGGEITFSSRPGGSRSGSDRASTIYPIEDSRHRSEQKALPYRARAPSQSDSQSRGYAPSHAPYEPAFAPGNNFF